MNRYSKVADALDQYGLDALLVTSEANRQYVTGFPSSAGMAIITKNDAFFLTDSRYIEAASNAITEGQVMEYGQQKPALALVQQILTQCSIRRLGFEELYTTVGEYRRWETSLHCEFLPASALLAGLRAVKDQTEIDSLIAAQRIAEKALDEVLDFIQIGRTEQEIAAFLQYRMLSHGAEKMSFDPIVVGGPNSSMPHGVPTDRALAAGDFLTMDFGCIYQGYCSDMTRTVALGYATEEMEQVYATVLEAQLAGIAVIHPGVTGSTIHRAGAKVISDAGYGAYFGHGFGHSLGIELHELPGAGLNSSEPLPAGTVITAEPGIYLPGRFGVRIEDVIVITEDKPQNITNAPKNLMIL